MLLSEFMKRYEMEWPECWPELVAAGDCMAARERPDGTRYRRDAGRGVLLYSLAAESNAMEALEIGSGRGYGSYCLWRGMKCSWGDAWVTTIDTRGPDEVFRNTLFPDGEGNESFRDLMGRHIPSGQLKFVHGESRDGWPELCDKLIFFVDGSHYGTDVAQDACDVLRYQEGDESLPAVIVFHDYDCPDTPEVKPALDTVLKLLRAADTYHIIPVATDGAVADDLTYTEDGVMGSLVLLPKGEWDAP